MAEEEGYKRMERKGMKRKMGSVTRQKIKKRSTHIYKYKNTHGIFI